jgi:vitamin K-dependent gamma-carboxylase
MGGFWARAREHATRQIDVASLAAFRVLFGAVMFVSVVRFVAKGWVATQITEPSFHFTYGLFAFVRPWPEPWMHVHFAVLAAAAAGITLGLFYRVSVAVFFVGFTYAELIDKATYLNHYYLVSVLSALLVVLPAGVAALCFQVGLVYFFAGLAKLNSDWLVRAEPLRIWLSARTDIPLFGPLLGEAWIAYVASYAGAAFDLGIAWLLLIRRTRAVAFASLVVFHVTTAALLPIGMFPWIMIAAATVFLDPSWPRRVLAQMGGGSSSGGSIEFRVPSAVAVLVALHCAVQTFVPLRGVFGGTSSAWTSRGFDFAWKVMIAEKSGVASFRIRDRHGGDGTTVDPRAYLTPAQERAMARDPEMIRALALEIARDVRGKEGRDVSVFADSFASINGRPSARLIDPGVDLTGLLPSTWLLPLPDP